MCGISGFYSKTLSSFNNSILKMNSAISHRGPDSNNIWQDKNSGIFFGHQRLSILDLSMVLFSTVLFGGLPAPGLAPPFPAIIIPPIKLKLF